jgi:hypothetical protein
LFPLSLAGLASAPVVSHLRDTRNFMTFNLPQRRISCISCSCTDTLSFSVMRTSRLRGCLCTCRCYSTGPASSPARSDPYNAFTTRFPEQSTSSSPDNPLSDLRISIKDNFATREGYTTCASQALETYSSPYDATVVQLLRQKGAHIVGKTNMDEFGMGSYGVHSYFGQVRNPIDPERVAGGSSSGAAASVAAGLCDV